MPIAQLLELWKKIEVEPMEVEVSPIQEEKLYLPVAPRKSKLAKCGWLARHPCFPGGQASEGRVGRRPPCQVT